MKRYAFSLLVLLAACQQPELGPLQKEGLKLVQQAQQGDARAIHMLNEQQLFGNLQQEVGSPLQRVKDMQVSFKDGQLMLDAELLLADGRSIRRQRTFTPQQLEQLAAQSAAQTSNLRVSADKAQGTAPLFVWSDSSSQVQVVGKDTLQEVQRRVMVFSADGKLQQEDIRGGEGPMVMVFSSADGAPPAPGPGAPHIMVFSPEQEFDALLMAQAEKQHGGKAKQVETINVRDMSEHPYVELSGKVRMQDGKLVDVQLQQPRPPMPPAPPVPPAPGVAPVPPVPPVAPVHPQKGKKVIMIQKQEVRKE